MTLNFVSFEFQRNTDDIDINKVIVSKPKKTKHVKKPVKNKINKIS